MIHIILYIAIPLETIRMFIVGREITALAKSKGVQPLRWVVPTIAMWIGLEGLITLLTWFFMGSHYAKFGFFVAIFLASIIYRIVKHLLGKLPDPSWEEEIDEIGKQSEMA